MSTLREIRRRLRSVENIKKITDAMERVAAARLRRAQVQAESFRPYSSALKKTVEELGGSPDFPHPIFERRFVKKSALIIVSADKGLSGSYNANILSSADRFLKKYNSDNIELLLFGKKAIEHYQRKNWHIAYKKTDWAGKIILEEIKSFVADLIDGFLRRKLDEIWLVYTHYVSVAQRNVIVSKVLNVEKEKEKTTTPGMMVEPSAEDVLREVLPRYCCVRIQEALYEAYASELAARIMAMQMASKNSEEMIESLTLLRNRVRQEAITREMIEISS